MTSEDVNPDHVTRLLARAGDGEAAALDDLFPLVRDQLHRLAEAAFRNRDDYTIQPTVLVHDVFLKLVDQSLPFEGRRHFYVVAAKAMRQLVIDHARARTAEKRGGDWRRVSLSDVEPTAGHEVDVVKLDAALAKLAKLAPRQAEIVELRYFAGRSIEETAATLGVSIGTVKGDWRIARAFLGVELWR